MKKPLLFIAIITCIVVGCKLDESGFPKGPGLLVNKWYLKEISVYNDPYLGSYDTVGFTTRDYYNFKSDKTFEFSSSGPDTLLSGKYNYDAFSGRIIFTTAEPDTAYVLKLTADSLLLLSEISASAGGNTTTDKTIYRYALK